MTYRPARRLADIEPFHVVELLTRARQLEAEGRDIIHMEVGEPDSMVSTLEELIRDIWHRPHPGEEETVDIEFIRWGYASFTLGLTNLEFREG